MDEQVFQMIMTKLESHDEKLDAILEWRYKLAGATLVMASIAGILTNIIINKVF